MRAHFRSWNCGFANSWTFLPRSKDSSKLFVHLGLRLLARHMTDYICFEERNSVVVAWENIWIHFNVTLCWQLFSTVIPILFGIWSNKVHRFNRFGSNDSCWMERHSQTLMPWPNWASQPYFQTQPVSLVLEIGWNRFVKLSIALRSIICYPLSSFSSEIDAPGKDRNPFELQLLCLDSSWASALEAVREDGHALKHLENLQNERLGLHWLHFAFECATQMVAMRGQLFHWE